MTLFLPCGPCFHRHLTLFLGAKINLGRRMILCLLNPAREAYFDRFSVQRTKFKDIFQIAMGRGGASGLVLKEDETDSLKF